MFNQLYCIILLLTLNNSFICVYRKLKHMFRLLPFLDLSTQWFVTLIYIISGIKNYLLKLKGAFLIYQNLQQNVMLYHKDLMNMSFLSAYILNDILNDIGFD